jgi:hypothetical protein
MIVRFPEVLPPRKNPPARDCDVRKFGERITPLGLP